MVRQPVRRLSHYWHGVMIMCMSEMTARTLADAEQVVVDQALGHLEVLQALRLLHLVLELQWQSSTESQCTDCAHCTTPRYLPQR
jgi:hypothetical protein